MNSVIHQDPVTIDKGSSFPGKQFPCLPVFVTSKTREEDLIRKIADDPKDGEYAIDLLIIAKYYERIADHAEPVGGQKYCYEISSGATEATLYVLPLKAYFYLQ